MILCCMSKAHFTADHGLAAVLVFGMLLVRLVKLTLTGVMHLKTKTDRKYSHMDFIPDYFPGPQKTSPVYLFCPTNSLKLDMFNLQPFKMEETSYLRR